jgi:hypothetical protein
LLVVVVVVLLLLLPWCFCSSGVLAGWSGGLISWFKSVHEPDSVPERHLLLPWAACV